MTFSYDRSTADTIYEGLRDIPKNSKGRRYAVRVQVPSRTIILAAHFAQLSGVVELVEAWMADTYPSYQTPRGRPPLIPVKAYVVATLASGIALGNTSYISIHSVLTGEWTRAERAAMGFAVSANDDEDALLDAKRRSIGYDCVTRLAAKVALTFDPKPYPSRSGLTIEQLDAIDATRDPKVMALHQARADMLAGRLMTACFKLLPEEIQCRWHGDLTGDGTLVKGYGGWGHNSGVRKVKESQSPEANAGIHARTQDRRDAAAFDTGQIKPDKTIYNFGYEGHALLMTAPEGALPVPCLVIGWSLDRPSVGPGQNLVTAVQGIVEANLPSGRLVTDMGYSQRFPVNFHLPFAQLGYTQVMMYADADLGVQATYAGFLMVEGTWYGPCIPQMLIDATKDFRAGRITEDVFRDRIAARVKYQARIKRRRKDGWLVDYRCPGRGDGATNDCPIVRDRMGDKAPAYTVNPEGRRTLNMVFAAQVPADPPTCCTNAESVTIPVDVGIKFAQEFPYESEEWRAWYPRERNSMEGKNRYLKDAAAAAIANVDHRRFRGYGKQHFALLAKLVGANFQTILAFVDAEEDREKNPPAAKIGRPKKVGWDNLPPGSTGPPEPMRIAGRQSTSEKVA